MIGALSLEVRGWLSGVSTAALRCAVRWPWRGHRASCGRKVGVAAAVNPDASQPGAPQSQSISATRSSTIERINTTGGGLVQVLLVDGSTFTVGPGSDLVIDKFVYDPNKGTGEVVASFTKGVMRFVGGKISKNEGGVTVTRRQARSPFAAASPMQTSRVRRTSRSCSSLATI